MIKIAITIVFAISTILTFGQKFIKPIVGVNFSNRILTSAYTARKDSLDKSDRMKAFPTAGIQFLFEKKPGREFYFGIDYCDNGFSRTRLNYQFLDTVHPDLGQIFDLSQGAQKNAVFTYHFKYLEIPVGCNFQFTPRHKMNQYTGWFNISLIPQFLIKHNLGIFLEGFSIDGINKFTNKTSAYTAAKTNCVLQSGSRFDINLKGNIWVTTDALFRLHLLNSAESSLETLRLYSLSAILGIRYEIGNF